MGVLNLRPATVQSPNDLMTLRNGDKLVGRVGSATAEEITFMIGETPTQTPHDQIEKIEWGGVTDTLRPLRGRQGPTCWEDHLTIQLRRRGACAFQQPHWRHNPEDLSF